MTDAEVRLDTAALVARSLALGADLAGVAAIGAQSILVVAVAHPVDRPELDWWLGRTDPPGNRLLAGIVQRLCEWVAGESGLQATHLPYHVERGGAYLKDAAALAGLGCIGRNNLLVTQRFGPRVRLRALTLDGLLETTGPSDFDPCGTCAAPCREACPQRAFAAPPTTAAPARPAGQGRAASTTGLRLPARDGFFSRPACFTQMDLDVSSAEPSKDATAVGLEMGGSGRVIRYCRACELSCLVGA